MSRKWIALLMPSDDDACVHDGVRYADVAQGDWMPMVAAPEDADLAGLWQEWTAANPDTEPHHFAQMLHDRYGWRIARATAQVLHTPTQDDDSEE